MAFIKQHTGLIQKVKRGDEMAFKTLFHTYADRLFSYIFNILKNEANAEEVVQDCFMAVWKNRSRIDLSKDFEAYLFTIAKRRSFNKLRADKRTAKIDGFTTDMASEQISAIDQLIQNELEEQVQQQVEMLPARQKQIFALSRVEGKSNNEISLQLKLSVQTVKNQISNSLKQLRKSIKS